MELTQAIDDLTRELEKKQREVAILELAMSVLQSNFAPELQVLEKARLEISEKQEAIESKEFEISEKISTIQTMQRLIESNIEVDHEEISVS